MGKNKLRNRQTAYLSTRMRIVIGTSIVAAASLLLIVVFNLSDVKETRAFSSGDYRTISSGDWGQTDIWEVFDGKNWSEASMPPESNISKIIISKGNDVHVTEEIVVSMISIEESAKLSLEANVLKVSGSSGKGSFEVFGTLEMGTCILEGNGDFVLANGATLIIGSDDGIDKKALSGNIQMKGKVLLNRDANYIFNGTVKQGSGNGLPGMIKNLSISNSSGVVLQQSFIVIESLNLEKGILFTGRFPVTIGTSSIAPGAIDRNNGSVCGKLKRWYGPINKDQIFFPMNDGKAGTIFTFTSDIVEYQKGMIEVVSHEGTLAQLSSNPFDARQVVIGITEYGYYTALLSNGPEEAWLKITSALSDSNNENKVSWKITKSKVKSPVNNVADSKSKIESHEGIQNIVCGPNPFKDKFFVRFFSDVATTAHVQLMNSGGQTVYSEQMNVYEGSNQFEYISKSDLPPGVYMLRISNTSEIHTVKLIRDK
ncbi:MAG: T9SS type A sorting domain-containing protein [Bacteroidetes bacterium]|nr:T9SS type A sorting domain-containing protein [Bacteroidota bacterium]